MAVKIQVKRGKKAGLPTLAPGEYGLATDTGELFIGGPDGNIQVAVLGSDHKLPSDHLPAHRHGAGDITSGILGVARGGTGKGSFNVNRLIYPSAATTLAQLGFPAVAGSVLRQGTSGAPYWTSPADLISALGLTNAAKIATGSYVGTGTYGASNPCSLTFDFVPRFVLIIEDYQVMLGSGEINHSGSGENRQFWSNENHQSGVASPQVVLFTRPAAGQPVSQQKYARQPSPASCPGSSPP